MKKHFLFFLAVALVSISCQCQTIDFIAHFPKGSSVIEQESINALNLWAEQNIPSQQKIILLRGHTDSDANAAFNEDLSRKRNSAVQAVLESKGFMHVQSQYYGEKWPHCASADENCMHENRRVEVILCDSEEELFALHQSLGIPQTFFVSNNLGDVITAEQGTIVYIPKSSFVRSDGTEAGDNIRIEMREYYSVKECMKSKLTTTSNGDLIESGGMIQIEAFDGNTKCTLANDSRLEIVFATQKEKREENMQVFYGDVKNGVMDWSTQNETQVSNKNIAGLAPLRCVIDLKMYDDRILFNGQSSEVFYNDQTEYNEITSLEKRNKTAVGAEKEEIEKTLRVFYADQEKRREEYLQAAREYQLQLQVANSLSAKGLGWINCDRFLTEKNPIDQYVSLENAKDMQCYLYFEGINALMSGSPSGESTVRFFKVPAGKNAKIICYRHEKDGELFDMKDIKTSSQQESLEPRPISKEELELQLRVFDKSI